MHADNDNHDLWRMGLSTFIFFWIVVLVTLTSITFDDLIIQIFMYRHETHLDLSLIHI